MKTTGFEIFLSMVWTQSLFLHKILTFTGTLNQAGLEKIGTLWYQMNFIVLNLKDLTF